MNYCRYPAHHSRPYAGFMKQLILALFIGLLPVCSHAEQIYVAVASNFGDTARKLSAEFEQSSGHQVVLVLGSTGKHYAQIVNGAPFDAFLAADSRRPKLLEDNKKVISGSRFSYALGRLALWSRDTERVDGKGDVLQQVEQFRHLAIANPKLAPYGRAARQVLQIKNQWLALQAKLLRGENIHQTFRFVHSGNAELGFVAWSQLKAQSIIDGTEIPGSYWLVPENLHQPIVQQGVQLSNKKAATDFMAYLHSNQAQKIIEQFGYQRGAQ